MSEFKWARSGGRWLLLVFLAGVFVGVLLARITGRGPAGDWLTGLAVAVVGLAASVVLLTFGWLLGSRSGVSSQVATSVPGLESKEHPDKETGVAAAPPTAEESGDGSVAVSPPSASVVEPEPVPAAGGGRFGFVRGQGKWTLHAHDLMGYESLQVSLGLDRTWLSRMAIPGGRQEMAREFSRSLTRTEALGAILFLVSLTLYAITRLWALDQFPINFFADEANQVLQAVDLVKRGFRDPQGGFLPMYFKLFTFYYPDISVYFHVVTATLFGKSIVVARASSAVVTIIATGALGIALHQVFRLRNWWTVVLLLAITPAWFLFSRTTFDTAGMSSLYALFIAFYLLYRYRSPRWMYPALILGAAAFYAYPSGQVAVGLLGLMLVISDWRYHWQQRRLWLWAIPLAILLAIPFISFGLAHPEEATMHLRAVNSFWASDISLLDKLRHAATNYLELLSPTYWFSPNPDDLIRHRMKDYGFLSLLELPLLPIGVVLCVRHFRESKYRVALAALLAAPSGVTVADPAIIRSLVFVIPAALVSALGLEWLLKLVKGARAAAVVSIATFVLLAALSLGMLQDALVNGPTWYSDYTLYGMQWGAKQLFQEAIPEVEETYPDAKIYVSDTWANGTDIFLRFFDIDPARVQMASINGWMEKKRPLDPGTVFIMPPDEYAKVQASNKFQNVQANEAIQYPDGRNGFYVVQLEYADNVDAIFAKERAAQHQPITEPVVIDGETVQLSHTKFDIGRAQDMFDGDPLTVARVVEANPAVLDFQFSSPHSIHGLSAYLGRSNVKVTAHLYRDGAAEPVDYTASFRYGETTTELPAGPLAEMNFDKGPDSVVRLTLELAYPEADETAHAHIFELKFR